MADLFEYLHPFIRKGSAYIVYFKNLKKDMIISQSCNHILLPYLL